MPRAELMHLQEESFSALQSLRRRRDSFHQVHSVPVPIDTGGSIPTSPSLSSLHNRAMENSDNDIDVVQPPITHSAAHPLPFISGSHRPFTIQSILNPLSPTQDFGMNISFDMTEQPSGTSAGMGDLGDPIERYLISLEGAQRLYALCVLFFLSHFRG